MIYRPFEGSNELSTHGSSTSLGDLTIGYKRRRACGHFYILPLLPRIIDLYDFYYEVILQWSQYGYFYAFYNFAITFQLRQCLREGKETLAASPIG